MKDGNLFVIEIIELNRRITVERALDDLIEICLRNGVHIESHISATKELLERYMSVVRSRNKVRRNWHPKQARACDEITLELITKDEFRKIVNCPNEQNSNALPPPSKVSGYAKRMAGEALALKPKQADNVVLKLKPFMDARLAKREPNAA